MKVGLRSVRPRLREPFASAHGDTLERELVRLTLEGADGVLGVGEAAPLQAYDGVAADQVRAAIEDCHELLVQSDGEDHAELLAACRQRAVLPQASAAIDLALWDLHGRRAGRPVWQLLGAQRAAPLAVNATIAAADRAGAAAQAAQARAGGFRCLKLKVGLGDDAGRVAAVRAAGGPQMAIRLDANGAWSVPEALAALRVLEPAGIELCEEPVHGLQELLEVSRTTETSISIDESAALPGALEQRWCSSVCLKLSRCGGISGLLDAATHARAAGYDVYIASTLDGPLGIAGALHAAAVIRPDRDCGLATLGLFAQPPDVMPVQDGVIALPSGPGLGDRLSGWYETA